MSWQTLTLEIRAKVKCSFHQVTFVDAKNVFLSLALIAILQIPLLAHAFDWSPNPISVWHEIWFPKLNLFINRASQSFQFPSSVPPSLTWPPFSAQLWWKLFGGLISQNFCPYLYLEAVFCEHKFADVTYNEWWRCTLQINILTFYHIISNVTAPKLMHLCAAIISKDITHLKLAFTVLHNTSSLYRILP